MSDAEKNRKAGKLTGLSLGCLIGCGVFVLALFVVAPVLVATVLAIGPDGIESIFTDILDRIAGY